MKSDELVPFVEIRMVRLLVGKEELNLSLSEIRILRDVLNKILGEYSYSSSVGGSVTVYPYTATGWHSTTSSNSK